MQKQKIIIVSLLIVSIGAFFYLFFSKNKMPLDAVSSTDNTEIASGATSTSFVSSTQKTTTEKTTTTATNKPKPVIPKLVPTPVVPRPDPSPVPEVTDNSVSSGGILSLTNKERKKSGDLSPLKLNPILNSIAAKRVDNMFEFQYFSHDSPNNLDMYNLTKTLGYNYNALGENIIRGDFDSSADVMAAWMKSAGHRANILSAKYDEIGIAIKKELFEGRAQWIGVQVFGRQSI